MEPLNCLSMSFVCPHCSKALRQEALVREPFSLGALREGRSYRCPNCGTSLAVIERLSWRHGLALALVITAVPTLNHFVFADQFAWWFWAIVQAILLFGFIYAVKRTRYLARAKASDRGQI